jgi:threonine/homoserine/homoserine lactone efflux protein
MPIETFILFVFTTAIVVFSPGAAAIAVASQAAANGGKRALAGVCGVALANVVYFVLSATGIAALIIASNLVFSIIKWAGVAYLLWLGTTAIFSRSGMINLGVGKRQTHWGKLFSQGFVVEFANPKALLYFAAILPQFVERELPILPQLVIMGLTTLAMDLVSYSAYGFLGDRIARGGLKGWVVNLINKAAGGALIYVGAKMASASVSR